MVKIETEKCVGCGLCIEVCATHALHNRKGKTYIDEGKCNDCGMCDGMCICCALTFEKKEK